MKWLNKIRYQFGKEYYININRIIIQDRFRQSTVNEDKWKRKKKYYYKHGRGKEPILLNRDFVLIDGYTSYLLYNSRHWGKVPVVFVDSGELDN